MSGIASGYSIRLGRVMTRKVERDLPIFPLGVVYFPGFPIRLRIFEERYKLMLADIQPTDSMFGVALIRHGKEVGGPALPYDMGTVAEITKTEDSAPGRISVAAVSGQRFRIIETLRYKPYIVARVELLDLETNVGIPNELLNTAKMAFEEYLRCRLILAGGWARNIEAAPDGVYLSYLIADSITDNPKIHQGLLEIGGPEDRLHKEIDLLKKATDDLRERLTREGPISGFSSN